MIVFFVVILQVRSIFGGIFLLPDVFPAIRSSTALPQFIINHNEAWLPDEWIQESALPEIIINRDQELATKTIPRMILRELRCFPGRYFRAKIHVKSSIPIPKISTICPVRYHGNNLRIDIPSGSFQECGVFTCGDDMCLDLRFPNIDGLRTASDGLVTLKCHPQKTLIAQDHVLRIVVEENHSDARRVSSIIEGGRQLPFRSHIALYKRNVDGTFTDPLVQGGEVLLGEDLMLRTQVRTQDGWNFTGMSDVSLSRMSKSGEVLNSVALITREGCVNPSMRAICPEDPSFDPPHGQKFLFKAATFPGMLPGEEVILNVRVFGCLNRSDCLPISTRCRRRIKRSTSKFPSEVSRIAFRVVLPERLESQEETTKENSRKSSVHLRPIFSLGAMAVLCFGCTMLLGVLWKQFNEMH